MTQALPQVIRTQLGDEASNALVNWVGSNHKSQLDSRLKVTETKLEARIQGVESQIREAVTKLEAKMATKDDLARLSNKMDTQFKWTVGLFVAVIGFMISQTGLVLGMLYFML